MTTQRQDKICINGRVHKIEETPLKPLFEARPDIPKFRGRISSCWRGYTAMWRIDNNVLYLTGFEQVHPTVILDDNVVLTSNKTVAEWYTGMLHVPMGYVHHYYADGIPLHEKEIHIKIEKGIVVDHEVVYNKPVATDESDNIPF